MLQLGNKAGVLAVEAGHEKGGLAAQVDLKVLHALGDHSGHERLDDVLNHTGGEILLGKSVQEVTIDGEKELGATRVVVRSVHAAGLNTQ